MSNESLVACCPVCNGWSTHLRENLYYCQRRECDHIFEWPPIVKVSYDAEYVSSRFDNRPMDDRIDWLRVGLVKSLFNVNIVSPKLLDVGYGNGAFIKAATRAGFDAYGIDVHGQASKYGVREPENFEDMEWDIVCFFDSLEHFSSLALPSRLVANSKKVIISLPSRPSDFSEPKPSSWKHYRPGEHLHYFCGLSIVEFIRRSWFGYDYLVSKVDLEDAIRGRLNGNVNIDTFVFVKELEDDEEDEGLEPEIITDSP